MSGRESHRVHGFLPIKKPLPGSRSGAHSDGRFSVPCWQPRQFVLGWCGPLPRCCYESGMLPCKGFKRHEAFYRLQPGGFAELIECL